MSCTQLPENIRFYRKANGMTQLQLAEKLFIAPQTVSKWESGMTAPDTERLCMLADLFNISLDCLIRSPSTLVKEAMIAVDGGGTKTDFVLFSASGEILKRVKLEGCNPNIDGIAHTKSVLSNGIDQLLSPEICITGVFAGIAGAYVGNNRLTITDFLKERYPYIKIWVEGDIYNVIGTGQKTERCIAVICGTGSVIYGYDGARLHRAGGWGYLFDCAGSGFDIGRDALRYCLSCESGESEKSGLYLSICQTIGGSVLDKLDIIYANGKDYIASFAPIVFEHYINNDATACRIIEKTADRLAELIRQIYQNYNCGDSVIIAGGLTAQRDILECLLKRRLPENIKLIFPRLPLIYGAAIQCMWHSSIKYEPEIFEQNFCQGLN